MVSAPAKSAGKVTAYEAELRRTEEEVAALEASLAKAPRDIEKRTRLAYRLYHRASLTENPDAFRTAEKSIAAAIAQFGPQEDLCLLKANLDFRFHRLQETEQDLRMTPQLRGRLEARSLEADLAFQCGTYQEARASYETLIQEHRSWDNLARLAHFHSKMGNPDVADQLYVEAEDELTAKEMRSFAWLELQRGVLDVDRGRYEDAAAHYQRANQAYSGSWLIDEHRAEILAATGRFDEAVELYLEVIRRTSKPELLQTLGELYVFINQPQNAAPCFERALAAYLASAKRGEVHYYHHLTDFYADVSEDAGAAVAWARKDLDLRENFSTQSALARALYKDGAIEDALIWIDLALSSGAVSAELFRQGAVIYKAAGMTGESARLRGLANAINPHPGNFHVHR